MWQKLLHNKYLNDNSLAQVEVKPIDLSFRKDILRWKIRFF
jgi:hypothetical protein